MKPTEKQTSSQIEAATVAAKLRSRAPVIVIVTPEEARVKPYLFEAAAACKPQYETRFYDIAQGFTDISGKLIMGDRGQGNIEEAFAAIKENRSRCVWVMCDLSPWLKEPIGLINQRALRNLIEWLPKQPTDRAQSIILLTANPDLPAEIANDATVINWPMPDKDEMGRLLDDACAPILTTDKSDWPGISAEELKQWAGIQGSVLKSITADARSAAIDAAIGLSGSEAASCFASSLVMKLRIDPVLIAQEKKRVIAKERLMEWIDPPSGGFEVVGGWENFKTWTRQRRLAYSPKAREYGLKSPRGVFLYGVSGCGKSLSAKCLGSEWGVPVIRLDPGALKSKFVGESEQNLRKALSVIEALGWCIVWIDEIEKALEGATSGSADGGVSADTLGTLLTWMQDRPGDSFVVATANDVSNLPPELMRKGRFDQIWWVDLPTRTERAAIVRSALKQRGRDADAMADMDLDAVAAATDTFTGAEIDALADDAMFVGFADGGREITTQDLINAAKEVVPLAETKKEQIDDLRKNWSTRAKSVSKADIPARDVVSAGSRQLDI